MNKNEIQELNLIKFYSTLESNDCQNIDWSRIELLISSLESGKISFLNSRQETNMKIDFENNLSKAIKIKCWDPEKQLQWTAFNRPILYTLYRRTVVLKLNAQDTRYMCQKAKIRSRILKIILTGLSELIKNVEEYDC